MLKKFSTITKEQNFKNLVKTRKQIKKYGRHLLEDPIFNKGCAFNDEERTRLHLRGLLPAAILTLEQQKTLFMKKFNEEYLLTFFDNKENFTITAKDLTQRKLLDDLYDSNETLFFHLLLNNIKELARIVYTPTVGWYCINYSKLVMKPRGLFISILDKNLIGNILDNWDREEVEAIVVTDGSRILGLKDQGVGGMGIASGKLKLYVAAAGFHPDKVLPIVLDAGTTEDKIKDEFYLGIKKLRIKGEEYISFVDEFMIQVSKKWPKALIQFEDFQSEFSFQFLDRYRNDFLMFNDDIQGTASVVLAGILGGLKILNLPKELLIKQRILINGAGSAAQGIISIIVSFLKKYNYSESLAYKCFRVISSTGLVTKKNEKYGKERFALPDTSQEGKSFLEVIDDFKPTVLIGVSGKKDLFSKEVLESIDKNCPDQKPMIFPLSNPTNLSECDLESAYKHTKGRLIFGSGSPFPDIVENGVLKMKANQTNNIYIFPGLALGAYLAQPGKITEEMILASSEALSDLLTEVDLKRGCIYPGIEKIREISTSIAERVIMSCESSIKNTEVVKYLELSKNESTSDILKNYIKSKQWEVNYSDYEQISKF